MRIALIADVGDRLCMAARTNVGEAMLIDWGSTTGRWNLSGSKYAFNGLCRISSLFSTPRTVFLSHIHIDHYNGLIFRKTRLSRGKITPETTDDTESSVTPSLGNSIAA